jgi:hypothetical protein
MLGQSSTIRLPMHPILQTIALFLCISGTVLPATGAEDNAVIKEGLHVEKKALLRHKGLVKRDGATLTLTLFNKRALRFVDDRECTDFEHCLLYRFKGLSPDKKFFQLEVLGWEWGTFYWISRYNGAEYEVYGGPKISPDQKYIVSANSSESGGMNGLFLWRIDGKQLREEFRVEPREYALYHFVRWRGSQAVELIKTMHSEGNLCPSERLMEIPATLIRESGQWVLDDRVRADSVKCGAGS